MRLGPFSYRVLESPEEITAHLRRQLRSEWLQDLVEFPDQPWTRRWLEELQRRTFELRRVNMADVRPLSDLMNWRTETYDFRAELESRVAEARETLEKERTLEPIVLLDDTYELIDGYMRFSFLREAGQPSAYAYVGCADAARSKVGRRTDD